MSEYIKTVETMENDRFRQLPPKLILEHCLSCILTDMQEDGGSREALYEAAGAVWMLSHVQFTQKSPIVPGDELLLRISPRMEKRSCYLYDAEILRGTETVVVLQATFVPVNKSSRHIVRIGQLTGIWKTPPREARASTMHRLRPDCVFSPCGSDEVRFSDCDCNGHMTSGAYLSLACNALGFWESDVPRFMKMMQVDYSSEVYPGTLLRFEHGELNGVRYVRGVKPDGKIAFTAACEF